MVVNGSRRYRPRVTLLLAGPLLLAPLLAAFAAAPPTLTYSVPQGDGVKALTDYQFNRYEAKDVVYVATPHTFLYPEGRAAAEPGREVVPGTKVTIGAVGATAESLEGRVNVWYEVTSPVGTGWIHGGRLTPYAWVADLDQDGEDELATVVFGDDFNLRVLVIEPNVRAGGESWLDLDSAGGAYISQHGGDATVELLKAGVAGIPLLHVYSGVEACADFADYWVSYRSPGPARLGTLRTALALSGLMDPPSSSTYEVKFTAKRSLADVTRTTGEHGAAEQVERARYRLVNGVYKQEGEGGRVER